MGLSYREDIKLPFELCDVKSDIKFPLLLDYCLTVSGRQSAQLGRSNDYLLEQYGLIWIVTDYEATIHRLPHFQETITIETKALSYNKFFVIANFIFMIKRGAF
ncbi:acyl-ACP thioesterase domain protein [Streptococcus dysgalactiae subsp. equisimilis SK1250]|nr:acyl-ACP thioesterase domain protein [Streptococcus dysgalactiae subsp. equisimilis SK1250]